MLFLLANSSTARRKGNASKIQNRSQRRGGGEQVTRVHPSFQLPQPRRVPIPERQRRLRLRGITRPSEPVDVHGVAPDADAPQRVERVVGPRLRRASRVGTRICPQGYDHHAPLPLPMRKRHRFVVAVGSAATHGASRVLHHD